MTDTVKNIEKVKDSILDKAREEVLELKGEIHESQRHYMDIVNQFTEKFRANSDSFDYPILDNPKMLGLFIRLLSNQANIIKRERSQIEEYTSQGIYRSKHNRKSEIWDSDGTNEEFEDFKLRRLFLSGFEDFMLSDEGIDIIRDEFNKYIDPQSGEFKSNYNFSEEALRLKLKMWWDSVIFKEYHANFGNYEINDYIFDMRNIIENRIDSIIWDYIEKWWDKFDIELINNIVWLLNEIEDLLKYSWDEEPSEWILEILEFRKDLLIDFLEWIINNYSYLVYKNWEISLGTWENQLDLQLKTYLYVYGKLFLPDLLDENNTKNWYDTGLIEVLKFVLLKYNPELEAQIKNKRLLEQKRKADQERRERELRRRQEAERRNRERNNNLSKNSWNKPQDWNQDSNNVNDNSWVNLVKNSNVRLSDFSVWWEEPELISENTQTKYRAFRLAWNDFIDSNDEIKNIITYSDMEKLYDIETNNIDDDARKSFLKTEIMEWRTENEIKHIYKTLQSFSSHFDDAIKSTTSRIIERKWKMDDEIKMYALWSVIDNVKDTFDSIVSKWQWDSKFEWFSFDSHEPVKRQWNDIIISGKFNWAEIKIRYNLISGWLFMNSFIQHLSPSKMTIWNNTDADYKIGQLESFDTILDEHYHSPKLSNSKTDSWNNSKREFVSQNYWLSEWWEWNQDDIAQWSDDLNMDSKKTKKPSIAVSSQTKPATEQVSHLMMSKNELNSLKKRFWDMLNANIDLIGDSVINHTKKQSTRNSVVIKFMKTFNIILDEENIKNIDVNNESNMFDFIQIIENSDSTALESFQIFMEKIMEYSWLSRWNNNLQWSQRNQKSDLVLHENDNNKYASLLRSCSIDFSNNIENLKWKLNFDSGSQLWFIDMICKNITNDTWKPNWKIDVSKMNEFIYHLENDPQTVV